MTGASAAAASSTAPDADERLGERDERRVRRRAVRRAGGLGLEPSPGVAPEVRGDREGLGRDGAAEPHERLDALPEREEQPAQVAVTGTGSQPAASARR